MTLRDEILSLIQANPGISDAEIARMLPGPKSRHQQVNARCRSLASEGRIRRQKPTSGCINNYPVALSDDPEGSPLPQVRETPPPMGAGRADIMPTAWGCAAAPPGVDARAVAPTILAVEFHWQSAGEMTLQEQSLSFPRLPERAGIYRIRLPVSRSVYVGETVNLRRRMQNYRTPGASQKTSIWLNKLLRDCLGKDELVILEACTEALTTCDDSRRDADLTSKTVRTLIENAAILSERHNNWTPLNKAN